MICCRAWHSCSNTWVSTPDFSAYSVLAKAGLTKTSVTCGSSEVEAAVCQLDGLNGLLFCFWPYPVSLAAVPGKLCGGRQDCCAGAAFWVLAAWLLSTVIGSWAVEVSCALVDGTSGPRGESSKKLMSSTTSSTWESRVLEGTAGAYAVEFITCWGLWYAKGCVTGPLALGCCIPVPPRLAAWGGEGFAPTN